ncbi:PLP-dependent aminotransferase family protein [Streptomyces scabiei]|nr:PLP-dependent aminotransferase family protein [Streptomyces sp. LBUM 1477]MBP5888505.1 PLP-dependent aminotransferase family protein [Streptomyces sp. LBUM 1487]QTU50536.1 PLP-dependent aminotransferase family protein [Streptomyces sp. LBUM 1482]QTU66759.1 PLP-dependent aminotransferase family protein [Streptomyces sp. LBUM 1475]
MFRRLSRLLAWHPPLPLRVVPSRYSATRPFPPHDPGGAQAVPQESTALPLGGFTLDRTLPEPLYQQLYERLKDSICSGQLRPGVRLPATRTLAQELRVSRNTVLVAYERLVTERFATGQVGSGTHVAVHHGEGRRSSARTSKVTRLPTPPEERGRTSQLSGTAQLMLQATRAFDERQRTSPTAVAQPFVLGVPALDLFPGKQWSRVVSRRAARLPNSLLHAQDPVGYWPLRKEVATYLGLARGVSCTAEQVVITNSTRTITHLLARVLLEPGDEVMVENPGFPGARTALVAAGVVPCPVDVDHEGLCISSGESRHPSARMALVTPNHQFPTGCLMSEFRRGELLDWAVRSDGWVIEDDYDGEFTSGSPFPPLQHMDTAGRVIYLGTLNKALFPALRLAYAVVPPDLVDIVAAAQHSAYGAPPVLEQAAVHDFMAEHHFARHIRRMRQAYRERREGCVRALRDQFGSMVRVMSATTAGTHLVAGFPPGTNERLLSRLSSHAGATVYPLSSYYSTGTAPVPALVLGFGATPPEQAVLGVRGIAAAFERSACADGPGHGLDG